MSQYYMLIKNNLIDFDKLMIDKYHLLGLNETDAIIIIKLNRLLAKGEIKLESKHLEPSMSLTNNTISKRIVDLVKNGYITLTLTEVDGSEVFSLDETYKKLSNILEKEDELGKKESTNNLTKEVVGMIESEFSKVITPIELEIINDWIYIDKFSLDKITEAIQIAKRNKKMNVKYVDVFLNKKPEVSDKKNIDENLQDLFNDVFGKITS